VPGRIIPFLTPPRRCATISPYPILLSEMKTKFKKADLKQVIIGGLGILVGCSFPLIVLGSYLNPVLRGSAQIRLEGGKVSFPAPATFVQLSLDQQRVLPVLSKGTERVALISVPDNLMTLSAVVRPTNKLATPEVLLEQGIVAGYLRAQPNCRSVEQEVVTINGTKWLHVQMTTLRKDASDSVYMPAREFERHLYVAPVNEKKQFYIEFSCPSEIAHTGRQCVENCVRSVTIHT
jgi:hypothetical protein